MKKHKFAIKIIKSFLKAVWLFICDQYLILFFILTIGAKLYYLNTYLLKMTWPANQYINGVVFGFLSLAVIFSPLYFVRKNKNWCVIIIASIISTLILIDTIYYSYFEALPSVGLISSFNQVDDVGPAIVGLLRWWFVFYVADILLAILFKKRIEHFFKKQKEKFSSIKSGLKTSCLAFVITIVAFLLGFLPLGFDKLAELVESGHDTISSTQYYGVIMAHMIDLTRFIEESSISISPDQEKAVIDWVKKNKPTDTTGSLTGLAKGKNVIMIQVESLGAFVINQKINDKEITPNLNNLAKTSQFFPNQRFVMGAGHTSDIDFVANSSYFPLTDSATFVRFGRDDFTGLPKIMANNGYSTFAYHGFNRNFWNRDTALESLGYQKFYAADNYPKGEKINLGLNDGDFLSKTAEYIKKQSKPSFSYVITLTSHVPFDTSSTTRNSVVSAGNYPYLVGGYLENINYVDRVLGDFFSKLKSEELYDDSLIIVYGDHTPVLPAFTAGTLKYDPDSAQEKEVPLFIKLPNDAIGKTYPNQGTHLDIMPTVLDLLGIKTSQLMFGKSLFAEDSKQFQTCPGQISVFTGLGDCKTALSAEKNISQQIIRYNLFNKLPK